MSAFMSAAGIIGVIGMGVGVGMSGYDAAASTTALKREIKTIKQNTEDIKQQYQAVIDNGNILTDTMKNKMMNNLDAIQSATSATAVARADFSKKKRSIEMFGIIFIVYIFFLFLLKEFGIATAIEDMILSPFRSNS